MTRTLALAALACALPATASAFCGTYVGGADTPLYANASQVALVWQNGLTTLTMANTYQGDLTEFALLVPVPVVLGKGEVTVIDPELIKEADRYSSPRVVSYACSDFWDSGWWDSGWEDRGGSSCVRGFGCRSFNDRAETGEWADSGEITDPAEIETVHVESEFTAGEYEIVVLSAEESGDLLLWLELSGYAVPGSTQTLLQEYIDAGAYFFAARVALDALPKEQSYLSPLQFRYASSVHSLPIRLGTANSPGSQDLILYVINPASGGAAGISNYSEVTVEQECLWRDADVDVFSTFYESRFSAAMGDAEAAWAREYAWAPSSCDPCPEGGPLDDSVLQGLGFQGTSNDAYFTRLHMRYSAAGATQDLVLYETQQTLWDQLRYVVHEDYLEDRYPICGEGWAPDPGSCSDNAALDREDDGLRVAASPLAPVLWVLLGVLGLAARRRSR